MTRYSFDDVTFGVTTNGRTVEAVIAPRPPGLEREDWYAFAGTLARKLNEPDTSPPSKRQQPIPRSTTIPWARGTGDMVLAKSNGLLYKLGPALNGGFDLRIVRDGGPPLHEVPEFTPNTAGVEWFQRKADALWAAQAVYDARASEMKAGFVG